MTDHQPYLSETATVHAAGDCPAYCLHPDHQYDGAPIDLDVLMAIPLRSRASYEDEDPVML